ncbi:hypothetical protein [Halodesulfovibrio sp.]|uniref:hypothetical protein n=1 Tax=Halodesulfovibrio sp. TaxID=1912772 RepID=UPI0025FF31A0|nr:hypothetical protein [Halodesulfovibrio sp.]MCT4535188.1 hypothetical protein [Halodesulfovibrio sp.]
MSEKYSVLIMRDDTNVRRYRVSPSSLRSLVIVLLFVVMVAVCGIFTSFSLWEKNTTLMNERHGVQKELRDLKVYVERLENIEQILQSNDPEELQALFSSMSVAASAELPPPIDLSSILQVVDHNLVAISNLKLQKATGGNLRLSLKLDNKNAKGTIRGSIVLSFVGKDGKVVIIDANKKDMEFSINRFKRIVTTFEVPDAIALHEAYALQLSITNNKTTLLQRIYPIKELL